GARLRDKAASAQDALSVSSPVTASGADVSPPPEPPAEPDDEARERAAWAAVRAADTDGSAADPVDTRLRLVREHLLPSRRLLRPSDVSAEAVALARESDQFATAVSLYHLPDVLLGNA